MIMVVTLSATGVGLRTAKAKPKLMAAIQEAAAAYFRSSSMVNSITNVQWMDTGKNGAPPLMISQKPGSGDCVSISIISFTPVRFLLFFLPSFVIVKGMEFNVNSIAKNGVLMFCGCFGNLGNG